MIRKIVFLLIWSAFSLHGMESPDEPPPAERVAWGGACSECKRAHKKCDGNSPCKQCKDNNKARICVKHGRKDRKTRKKPLTKRKWQHDGAVASSTQFSGCYQPFKKQETKYDFVDDFSYQEKTTHERDIERVYELLAAVGAMVENLRKEQEETRRMVNELKMEVLTVSMTSESSACAYASAVPPEPHALASKETESYDNDCDFDPELLYSQFLSL